MSKEKICSGSTIIAVTVTYADRWQLLKEVIESALSEEVSKVIVVDNGSLHDIDLLTKEAFGSSVDVITLKSNTGSSGGFKAGLKHAMSLDPDYILLLDDDNKVKTGAIKSLLEFYRVQAKVVKTDNLAVLAFRPVRLVDVTQGVPASKINPREGSYFGFHILDVPYKLWRRLWFVKKRMEKSDLTSDVFLKTASWSGLFFKPDLVERHGYPDTNLVLYADDTEFSLRVTESGGRIALCTEALIEDIDQSWNLKSMYGNTFDGLLLGSSDFRAYYSTRNQAYLEYHRKKQVFFWSPLNRFCHKLILTIRATILNKAGRWKWLMKAMSDGKQKQLGVNRHYPLS